MRREVEFWATPVNNNQAGARKSLSQRLFKRPEKIHSSSWNATQMGVRTQSPLNFNWDQFYCVTIPICSPDPFEVTQ